MLLLLVLLLLLLPWKVEAIPTLVLPEVDNGEGAAMLGSSCHDLGDADSTERLRCSVGGGEDCCRGSRGTTTGPFLPFTSTAAPSVPLPLGLLPNICRGEGLKEAEAAAEARDADGSPRRGDPSRERAPVDLRPLDSVASSITTPTHVDSQPMSSAHDNPTNQEALPTQATLRVHRSPSLESAARFNRWIARILKILVVSARLVPSAADNWTAHSVGMCENGSVCVCVCEDSCTTT